MTNEETVISAIQPLLEKARKVQSVTPDLIDEMIDAMLQQGWIEDDFDRNAVKDELIRRFSFWIDKDTVLTDDEGHKAWLVFERKKGWRYWPRYRQWLGYRLDPTVIGAMEESTSRVLGLLEDPTRPGQWDRRGLVVGQIQSGKTGHYIGLISKAADAGYKIIIVLAGLHNNLRSQTQMRLDEGFIGYETNPNETELRAIGVGIVDPDPGIRPSFATNRTDQGDFTTKVANQLGVSPEERPWLFVVKKHKVVLERLLYWIGNHVADPQETEDGRRVVTKFPLLMIDDEADHASVDTGEKVVDASGRPDEDHQPTAINRCIRRILHSFARSAYVGYTATPFANIFIHDRAATAREGLDLFPSAFIVNMAAPSNYVGPRRLFNTADEENEDWLGLVKIIENQDDDSTWMPLRHKNGHVPLHNGRRELPPSLATAIDAFLLACAARLARGDSHKHSSMLIHVTRFTSVQDEVHQQVESHLKLIQGQVRRDIGTEDLLDRLQTMWEQDFVATTRRVRSHVRRADFGGWDSVPENDLAWHEVAVFLHRVVDDVKVKVINGTAKDALDYREHEGTGLTVIAIGGDKLSRGLTLEGLCVSYFLRSSRMYDTLMQMGRWFGYRPNYLDLCRLYTTTELAEWFEHITAAADELRDEFDRMADTGSTPKDYGLKVKSHPVLMVTSPLKMRAAHTLMLNFSGELVETVSLYRTRDPLQTNLDALRRLLRSLGEPEIDPVRERGEGRFKWSGHAWGDVPVEDILEFLGAYSTHRSAHSSNTVLISKFIRGLVLHGELTGWTVALIGGGEGRKIALRDDVTVSMLKRRKKHLRTDGYSIGRLISPRDEAIDLDRQAWMAALELTRSRPVRGRPGSVAMAPSGPDIREIRGFGAQGVQARPDRGLLLLYVLDPGKSGLEDDLPGVVAFAMSFPKSRREESVEYEVNNVAWQQEYGSAD